MKVLILGGAGYIGSTVASLLLDKGHTPVIVDSLTKGRLEFTAGKIFYQGDIADKNLLQKVFSDHPDIQAAIHFAALISVPESEADPAAYYRENVCKSVELFSSLKDLGCKKIIFSSSGSVYGESDDSFAKEENSLKPASPYARTKMMMELVLKDFCQAYALKGIALRYFNPIGADPKMRSGAYDDASTSVMRSLLKTSSGEIKEFFLTGTDWPTRDGSGIRDYIHVWDLANAHLLALENFDNIFPDDGAYDVINLGTGNGVTVKELLSSFEKVLGRSIPKKELPARPGDVAGAYANKDKAERLLGWKPELSLEQAISDAINWEKIKKQRLS